jgi:hypothetical protein
MFPKCSYCRHKIRCQLSYGNQEFIKQLWDIIKDTANVIKVEKNKNNVVTVTVRNTSSKNIFALTTTAFQKHKRKWFCYAEKIDCIVLKCQLELIKKQGGY